MINFIPFLFLFSSNNDTSIVKKRYYIVDKGIYIQWEKKDNRKKVKFKKNNEFYFSIKNDSIALIQSIQNGKLNEIKEYKVSQSIDTVYIKKYFIINGNVRQKVVKEIFQKIILPNNKTFDSKTTGNSQAE
jgi:hypothetical protein